MAGCLEVVPRYNPLGFWQGGVGISQVLYSPIQKDCAWSECVLLFCGRICLSCFLMWTHFSFSFIISCLENRVMQGAVGYTAITVFVNVTWLRLAVAVEAENDLFFACCMYTKRSCSVSGLSAF